MPELPEVQTVVSQLEEKVTGKTIKSVWSEWLKAVRPSLAIFERRVIGAKIVETRRKGKHIVLDLDNDFSIVIHLKMTGHLLVKHDANRDSEAFRDPYNQFIHHILTFADGTTLEFSDMRKFGWMEAMPTAGVETLPSIASLGIDALSEELTPKTFDAIIEKKGKSKIGALLLDQTIIAGIGNIYRSEALFQSGILPERLASSLSKAQRHALLMRIKKVLRKALTFRGMSDGDFRDTDGREGEFQKILGVYGRDGKPCPKCGTMIQRVRIGQRSAFFCPTCQR
ncbi:MAG: DNA-formamidopyrimidine glycosylase [Candidatus Moranbacteria bacterium]|nr:DNA-formamidopyrimidine glycosylase [Candidatus Moranbacteria bacterium]